MGQKLEMSRLLKSEYFNDIFRIGEDGIPEFGMFIGGDWVFGDQSYEVESPNTGEIIARVSIPDAQQIESAIQMVYEQGRRKIRDYPGEKRVESFLRAADMMKKSFDDFVNTLIVDAGKPKKNAQGEVNATIERLEKTTMESRIIMGDYIPGDWSEETLESEAIVKREPYGLILAISPFNYPLFITSSKVIPSLLSGNSIVLKPASADPLAALLFTRLLELSEFPKESFSTMGLKGRETGALVGDRRIRTITFTGSTETGADILRNAGIKHFHMELGGKDPVVVLEDADLENTIPKIVKGITGYSGQRCDAVRLIIVEEPAYDEVKRRLVESLRVIEPKNPEEDEEAMMGPLIDEKTADYVQEIYNDAVDNGADSLLEFRRSGGYLWPMIVEADKENLDKMRGFNEDVFAPFSILVKVKDEDEAIEVANSPKFGLDAAVFGNDEARVRKIARKLEVGSVFVNEYPRHGIGYYPFGGMKDSGIGREGIGYSIAELTTTKTIVYNYKGYGVWEYL